jgi:hypothetical protein
MHDRKTLEQIIPFLPSNRLTCYADKAYQVQSEAIHQEQKILLLTPVKKRKRTGIFRHSGLMVIDRHFTNTPTN